MFVLIPSGDFTGSLDSINAVDIGFKAIATEDSKNFLKINRGNSLYFYFFKENYEGTIKI